MIMLPKSSLILSNFYNATFAALCVTPESSRILTKYHSGDISGGNNNMIMAVQHSFYRVTMSLEATERQRLILQAAKVTQP